MTESVRRRFGYHLEMPFSNTLDPQLLEEIHRALTNSLRACETFQRLRQEALDLHSHIRNQTQAALKARWEACDDLPSTESQTAWLPDLNREPAISEKPHRAGIGSAL